MTRTTTTTAATVVATTTTTVTTAMTADASMVCAACNASGVKLWLCARCKQTAYCGRGCQLHDWQRHRESCSAKTSHAASTNTDLSSKLKVAVVLARQKEGRVTSSSPNGFRRHEMNDFLEHQKEKAAHDRRIAPALWFQKVGYFDTKRKNFERGAQCRGQGCRHQNAAVHSQTGGGGRNAKWSSTTTAAKSRKNYKSVK